MAKIQELYSEVVIKYDEASVSGLLNLLGELEKRSEDLNETLSGQLNKTFKDTGKSSGLLTKQTDQLATVMKKPVKNSGMLVKQTTQLAVVMEKQTKKNKTFKQSLVVISSTFLKVSKNSKRMGSDIKKSFSEATKESKKLKKSMSGMQKLATAGLAYVGVTSVKNFYEESAKGYETQFANEVKLKAILKNTDGIREGATKRLGSVASKIQDIGIIGDEVTLGGMQQLATFKLQEESIAKLAPGMADLLAQQKNFNATSSDAVNIGNLMGKVMEGQVGALTRVGISMDENQKVILKFGNEQQKVAILSKVLKDNVGGVNKALRETPIGVLNSQKNTWGDVKEEIGEGVIPLVSEFYGLLVENKDGIKALFIGFLDVSKMIADEVIPIVSEFMENLDEDDIKDFFDGATEGAEKLGEVLKPLVGLAEGVADALSVPGMVVELFKTENETIAINEKNKQLKKELELKKELYKQKTGMDFGDRGKILKSQNEIYSKYGTMDMVKIGIAKSQVNEAGRNTIDFPKWGTEPSVSNTSNTSSLDKSKQITNHTTIQVTTKKEDEIGKAVSREIEIILPKLI